MEFLFNGPQRAPAIVILAHGAGAAMDSSFMNTVAEGIAANGLRLVRFEFPYMQRRREHGTSAPPDRAAKLLECYEQAIRAARGRSKRPLFIGGKSMGGRIATMVADQTGVQGVICFGYPFHPAGKPDRLRISHLAGLATPCLILQGERDAFGNRAQVSSYTLADSIQVQWLTDGDHSLKPRKSSGLSETGNLQQAVDHAAQFVHRLRVEG